LTMNHKEYIKQLFEKTLLFEKRYNIENNIGDFVCNIADYLIDDIIYTDDYDNQSGETPLLIPDVNFSASFMDNTNEPFELTLNIKDEKLILGVNLC